MSVICVAGYVYMWCICVLCVHVPVPAGNKFLALLLVGSRDMEQQQPHISLAVRSGKIYFPLTKSVTP